MRRYLSTLHKRSDSHKKNFALLVSGGLTLTMFGIWFFVNYGEAPVVAQNDSVSTLAVHEVTPLESLTASVTTSWEELRGKFETLFNSLGTVNFDQGYEEMKTNTFDQYGR